MTGSSLVRWARLENRRRRQARGVFAGYGAFLAMCIVGCAIAAEVWRRSWAMPAEVSELLIATISVTHLVVVFGAAHRLYWRHDSQMLGRLAIPGRSLYWLATYRGCGPTAGAVLVSAGAIVASVPNLGWDFAVRHGLVLLVAALGALLLAPASALAAGSVVASDRIQTLIDSVGGEVRAPKTSWLGILPGLAATAVATELLALSPWAAGHLNSHATATIVACSLAPCLLWLCAWFVADHVVPLAVREVAALDSEILAHVERSAPSRLERIVGNSLVSKTSKPIFLKDAILFRRRYPSPYYLVPIAGGALWVMVLAGSSNTSAAWGVFVCSCAYSLLLARRLTTTPIEEIAMVRTLPIGLPGFVAAKRAKALLTTACIVATTGPPLLWLESFSTESFARVGCLVVIAMLASRMVTTRALLHKEVH